MSVIFNFLANNYIWFLIISLILIFALIGYLVDTKQDERFSKKIEIDKELEARMSVAEATNMTINQMVEANDKTTATDVPVAENLEVVSDSQDNNEKDSSN